MGDNQWLMWDKFNEINGPEDLIAIQTQVQDLHDKEWKEVKDSYGRAIYDEDGDGLEDNVYYTSKQLDKFYKPNNYFPTENIYNTRHGNLPGHIQAYFYRGQSEPEDPYPLVTHPIRTPDATIY